MKNLFSILSRKRRWTVLIASFIVFVATTGGILYETTKKTVALTIDGQEKIIKTHANTVEGIFDDLHVSLRSEDYVFPSVNTKVKNNLKVVFNPAKQVQLVTDGEKKTVWTTATTVAQLLKEQKIALNEHDEVLPRPDAKLTSKSKVKVNRAFNLTFIDGGIGYQVWSTSTTVADFLVQQGIKLNQLDRVEPKPEQILKENDTVKVIRVEKVTDVVEEPVEFATITQKDDNLAQGTEKVVQEGQQGLIQRTYEIVKENGKEVIRNILNETKIKDKQDKIVAVGTLTLAQQISRGSAAGQELYVSSTAYTASCNGCSGTTATGINLRANPDVKVIAVDPSIIPLGTKVYVEGYGYAVAADTGSAIKGYKIDVFLPSQADAYRWGVRKVKIRIL
ncbi:ubiquitin-like domain-containing protein [Neobacillus sp. LXY-4]|uniref:ubiquitin-like domain-containing protein n=1 Tax=Neobacillus sp. LXY-4 TaxID=3379826 RepID=UPI003EDFFB8D